MRISDWSSDVCSSDLQLSGGQRGFLTIARALASPSRLLFLDEPTGAMDTQSERLFIEALDRAVAKSQTLIIATHREAILQMCDRIIVIDGGRIVADGPRADILARTSKESATREPAT